MNDPALSVLVLRGGPDRERDVSLMSGRAVAAALREAGHRVTEADVTPGDTGALDAFAQKTQSTTGKTSGGGGVVFPVLHGRWGEGGGAQKLLEQRGLAYVGSGPKAAALCMDKTATKSVLKKHGVPTPKSELVETTANAAPTLKPPVVLKPNDDGSSIDLAICMEASTLKMKWDELAARNRQLLVERCIVGKEITIGWVDGEALPAIWIRPATEFYDYDAKYQRDDTRYLFDLEEPPEVVQQLTAIAQRCCTVLGVRHLGRVDVMLDGAHRPWVIEVNTMPGFTDHSLLPMAARRGGVEMPALCDRLVRLALRDYPRKHGV